MRLHISYCPRCHEDHGPIEFIALDNAHNACHYWAMCPTSNHPILVQVHILFPQGHFGPEKVSFQLH